MINTSHSHACILRSTHLVQWAVPQCHTVVCEHSLLMPGMPITHFASWIILSHHVRCTDTTVSPRNLPWTFQAELIVYLSLLIYSECWERCLPCSWLSVQFREANDEPIYCTEIEPCIFPLTLLIIIVTSYCDFSCLTSSPGYALFKVRKHVL